MNVQKIIDKKTKEIITEVKSELSGFYKHYTLDLDAVCAKYDIQLLEADLDTKNISGALSKADGKWTIILNSDDHTLRRRFTIAHELGHYFAIKHGSEITASFLDRNDGIITDNLTVNREDEVETEKYQAERQANMIAAEILMPEEMVRSLFEEKTDIPTMASFFRVSEPAMSYRLKSLRLIPNETMYT